MKNLKMFAIGLVAFAAMTMGVNATTTPGKASFVDSTGLTHETGSSVTFKDLIDAATAESQSHDNAPVEVKIEDGDITANAVFTIDANVILNLGDYKLNMDTYYILVEGEGTLTVKGTEGKATITNASGALYSIISVVGDNNHLTIEKGVTIDNIASADNVAAIGVLGNRTGNATAKGTTVTINGTVKSINGFALTTNGALTGTTAKTAPTITIADGAVIESENEAAYYQGGYALATIGKATITGATGVGVKAGLVVFNGTTVTGNGKYVGCATSYKDGGLIATGAAVQVEGNGSYKSPAKVVFNGGEYTSENNSAVMACAYGTEQALAKDSKINDGEFTSGTDEDDKPLANILLYFEKDDNAVDYINDLEGFIVKGVFNGPIAGTATVGNNSMAAATLLAKLAKGADITTDPEGNSVVNGSTAGQNPSDEQKPNTGDGANTPDDSKNPQTGDSIMTYMGLGIASIVVVGLGAKNLRKQTVR